MGNETAESFREKAQLVRCDRSAMVGHRRDQSDSNVPLRQCSEFHLCPSAGSQDLSVQIEPPNVQNGMIISSSVSHPCDPTCDNRGQDKDRPFSFMPNFEAMRAVAVFLWRGELEKTLVAFCLMLLSAFLNFFLLTVIHDVVPREPLPDLVFKLIPQQRWAWAVGDVFSTVSSFVGFSCVFLHVNRTIVFRRLLLLGAIMYGLRAVVMAVTFLPPSFHNREEICVPQVNRTAMYATEVASRFITYVVTLGLTSGQEKILCGDLMFSGHTVVLTLMYFVQLYYTPRGLSWLRWFAAPILIFGVAALVVSGGHYTMDVLIAYWLTSHVFFSYHQIFEMPRDERSKAPLSRMWWYWVCYWFEKDVPEGPLKNEWDWPFSKPFFIRTLIAQINAKLQ